jgi:Replication-relaxation
MLQLSGFRYLTEPMVEEFPFGGSAFTPLSQQVITRRVLGRLKRKGLILETPRLVGPTGGTARLVYFLTAKGYNVARSLNPGLPSRQPNLRGTSLMGHGLLCAEVALAFRRAARSNPGHELLDWECDWQTAERLGAKLVVPDAHLVYSTKEWILDAFIEVDLATEGSRVFAWKIRRYLDLYRGGGWIKHVRVWPRILTIAPTQARARILRRVTETVVEAQLFRERLKRSTAFGFTTLEDLLGSNGPLGEIWSVVGKTGLHSLFRPAADADAAEASSGALH